MTEEERKKVSGEKLRTLPTMTPKVKETTGSPSLDRANEPVKPTTPLSNVEIFKRLWGDQSTSEEERAKETKKFKRNIALATLGDGLSALSNVIFTAHGAPNMYDGKNSMSERTRTRYDALKGQWKAEDTNYFNGLYNAWMRDKEEAKAAADTAEDKARWNWEQTFKAAQEAAKNAREQAKENAKVKQQAITNDHNNRKIKVQEKNADSRAAEVNSKANGSGSKKDPFVYFDDGNGTQFKINDSQWETSYGLIFDKICKDMEASKRNSSRVVISSNDTTEKTKDFVRKNWFKYPSARALIDYLSRVAENDTDNNIKGADNDIVMPGLQ